MGSKKVNKRVLKPAKRLEIQRNKKIPLRDPRQRAKVAQIDKDFTNWQVDKITPKKSIETKKRRQHVAKEELDASIDALNRIL